MKDGVLEQASKDIIICHFVEKGLKPLGFDNLVFHKRNTGKVDIVDSMRGDPALVLGDKEWEPIRARIFNEIKELLAKPQKDIESYMKDHEEEIQSVMLRYRAHPRLFVPSGPLGHHTG